MPRVSGWMQEACGTIRQAIGLIRRAAEKIEKFARILEAQLQMKRDRRDEKYAALNQKRSRIGQGVVCNSAYGDDSPLYGAMGFVRKSDRASGLTRKTKTPAK